MSGLIANQSGCSEPSVAISRGIYILGNDVVAGFLEALFKSLTIHAPALPVRLIPYDDRLEIVRPMCERFGVIIHEDPAFTDLEAIGRNLWSTSPYSNHPRLFRRFCAFWGPFGRFLYLDADICVLDEIEPLFDVFEKSGYGFASFDNDHERVYLPGPFRERMIRDYGSIGFNSGHFLAQKGFFNLQELQDVAAAAAEHAHEFQDRTDQGFMNFAVDYCRKAQVRLPALVADLADKQWAEQPVRRLGGHWRINRPGTTEHGRRLVLMHWSGFDRPGWHLPNRRIYYRFLFLGLPIAKRMKVVIRNWWDFYASGCESFFNNFRIEIGRRRERIVSMMGR